MRGKDAVTVAALSSLLTAGGMAVFGFARLPSETKLDNSRVKVEMTTYPPGIGRDRDIRATDQVIVFLDDCKYQRIDTATGEKTIREHKAGDVIWHNKGEDAPVLTNLGTKPYRTLTIQLK